MEFFLLPMLAVAIYIEYRFLRTLRNVLLAVSEQNRTMQPDHVWLNFIPLFGLAWMLVTVVKIRDSARAEFTYKGLEPKRDTGFGVGMTYALLFIVSAVLGSLDGLLTDRALLGLTVAGGVMDVAAFVCWLIYWRQSSMLEDVLITSAPVWGSPAAPGTYAGYQPRSWEMPPESQATVTAQRGGGNCSYCGAVYNSGAVYCASCGRPTV